MAETPNYIPGEENLAQHIAIILNSEEGNSVGMNPDDKLGVDAAINLYHIFQRNLGSVPSSPDQNLDITGLIESEPVLNLAIGQKVQEYNVDPERMLTVGVDDKDLNIGIETKILFGKEYARLLIILKDLNIDNKDKDKVVLLYDSMRSEIGYPTNNLTSMIESMDGFLNNAAMHYIPGKDLIDQPSEVKDAIDSGFVFADIISRVQSIG